MVLTLTVPVLQEALRYFNQTTTQKEMLEFALNYLQTDDEVREADNGLMRSWIFFGFAL